MTVVINSSEKAKNPEASWNQQATFFVDNVAVTTR